jgi:hypothetical protein
VAPERALRSRAENEPDFYLVYCAILFGVTSRNRRKTKSELSDAEVRDILVRAVADGPRRQGGSEGVRRSTGHGIGVSLEVYTSSSIGQRAIAAKKFEDSVLDRKGRPDAEADSVVRALNAVQKSTRFSRLFLISITNLFSINYGAGDGVRTRDVQLGEIDCRLKIETLASSVSVNGDRKHPVFKGLLQGSA